MDHWEVVGEGEKSISVTSKTDDPPTMATSENQTNDDMKSKENNRKSDAATGKTLKLKEQQSLK